MYAFPGTTVMSVTNFSTQALKSFKNSTKEKVIMMGNFVDRCKEN